MRQGCRLMLYAPHVPGGDTACARLATELRRVVDRTEGWELALTARKADAAGKPVDWPIARLRELPERSKGGEKDRAYQNADVRDIAQLTRPDAPPFDVLFLPYAWCTIPLGCSASIPAPIVAQIPNLEFDFLDYGLITDQFDRDFRKLMALNAAFVFSSEATRRRAMEKFGVDAARTRVIPPAASYAGQPLDIAKVRAKYRLPEKYLLCDDPWKPQRNGAMILEAWASRSQSPPLVCVGTGIDEFLATPLSREPYAAQFRETARRLGMIAGRDYVEIPNVPVGDLWSVIAGASIAVYPSLEDGAVPSSMLDAMALGTPVVYGRIDSYVERLGDMDDIGIGCASGSAEDIGRALSEAAEDGPANRQRVESARLFAQSRPLSTVAREVLHVCSEEIQFASRRRMAAAAKSPVSREQRVAWLINHTTLRDFEVPLIRSLGLEVYTSKLLPKGNDIISITVDYSEDENSTAPRWVLDFLNRQNFYEDPFSPELAEILNSYFGTVICTAVGPMVNELVRNFRGRILIRVFGREHPHNYSDYLNHFGGAAFWASVWRIQQRFWFGQCYASIGTIERRLLRDRTMTLPLGLPSRILRRQGEWRGNDKRILFVCSRIKASPTYYGRIYEEFKHHFGDLPHLIAGTQPIAVDDPNVSGFAPDHTFRHWLSELRVMFYHSREPRHLHYHPLEAVVHGMPLVYMKGGLLEGYGGPDQPGACDTLEEARKKIVRILDDDFELIERIRERQQVLLEEFLWEYNRREWQNKFFGQALASPIACDVPTIDQWRDWVARPVDADDEVERSRASTNDSPPVQIIHYGPPRDPVDFEGTLIRSLTNGPLANRSSILLGGGATPDTLGLDNSNASFAYMPDFVSPGVLASLAADEPFQFRWNSVESIVDAISQSSLYRQRRAARFALKLGICGLLYLRGAWRQKSPLPRRTGIANYFPRALLDLPGVHRIFAWNSARQSRGIAEESEAEKAAGVYSRYLIDPPPAPAPELPDSPELMPMEFDLLTALTAKQVSFIPRPFGVLPSNLPIERCREQPIVVFVPDLDFDCSERYGPQNLSMARQFVLWGRIAHRIVFASASARDRAVQRFGIDANRTRIVPLPALAEVADRSSTGPSIELPDRYVLSFDGDFGDACGIETVRAAQLLRWQSGISLPIVFVRRKYAGKAPTSFYAFKQAFESSLADLNWERGNQYFVVELDNDAELPRLYLNAAAVVTSSRSAATALRVLLDAFWYRTPAVGPAMAETHERIGHNDDLALLVDSQDSLAIAAGLRNILENPESTQTRVERAAAFVRQWTMAHACQSFVETFRETATWLAGSNGDAAATSEQKNRPMPISRAA